MKPIDTDFECVRDFMRFFEKDCMKFSDYGLKYVSFFFDRCADSKENFLSMVLTIRDLCKKTDESI
jgi:hypothetical protein